MNPPFQRAAEFVSAYHAFKYGNPDTSACEVCLECEWLSVDSQHDYDADGCARGCLCDTSYFLPVVGYGNDDGATCHLRHDLCRPFVIYVHTGMGVHVEASMALCRLVLVNKEGALCCYCLATA